MVSFTEEILNGKPHFLCSEGLFDRFLKKPVIEHFLIIELINHPSMTDKYLIDKRTLSSNILKYNGSILEHIGGNNLEQLNMQLYEERTA